MKKDQNLPIINIHSFHLENYSSGKQLPNCSNFSKNQSTYNSNYIGRSPGQRNSRKSSQNRYSRSHSRNTQYRNNYSRSNSNRPNYSFDTSSPSHSRNRHYSNDRSRYSSYNRHRNYSNNRNRCYSNNRNQRYNNRSRDFSNNRSNHQRSKNNNDQNRSRDNSKSRNSTYNNRQRNLSQPPNRNNTRYSDSQNKYRSKTPKYQGQINQVQTTEETNSDPLGIDNTETTELRFNHINCESTDSENDTENTILVNMIEVENDYETVRYEQHFHSHINENHLELI